MSLATGCFDPINKLPETTQSSDETTGPDTSESGNTVETTLDADETETDTETTGITPSMADGLLGCDIPSLCALWVIPTCGDACSLDETGNCVLEALEQRVVGAVEIQVSPSAAHQVLVFRGHMTPDVLSQDVTFEGDMPVSYGPIMRCQLADKNSFSNCKMNPNTQCLKTSDWMSDCVEVDDLVCPTAAGPS